MLFCGFIGSFASLFGNKFQRKFCKVWRNWKIGCLPELCQSKYFLVLVSIEFWCVVLEGFSNSLINSVLTFFKSAFQFTFNLSHLFSGRSVIGQKSELECALQKQKERQFILEQQQQQDNSRNDLEDEFSKVMMERAQKLEKSNLQQEEEHVDPQLNLEYLNARAKLRDVRSNVK